MCTNNRCIDPCVGLCGVNANCVTRNHIGTCTCLPGHVGDPFSGCHVADPRTYLSSLFVSPLFIFYFFYDEDILIKYIRYNVEAACKPSPCGENTQCEVINEVPVCTCLPGYRGSPLAGCRHECESDHECSHHLACSSSFRCESPCKCGENAECQVINHQAKCTCPKVCRTHPRFLFFEEQIHKPMRGNGNMT